MGIGFSKDDNGGFSSDKNKNNSKIIDKIKNSNSPSSKGSTVTHSNAQNNKKNVLLESHKKTITIENKRNSFFRCTDDSSNGRFKGIDNDGSAVEVVGVDFSDDSQQSKQEEQNGTVNNNSF